MTDSVFRNCLKWMQKNLEAQFQTRGLPPPKAYVSRLAGMRELNHLQRPKQMAQRAIAAAKDAALLNRLQAHQRAPPVPDAAVAVAAAAPPVAVDATQFAGGAPGTS